MSPEDLPYGTSVIPEISHWTGSFYLHIVRRSDGKLYVPKDIHWVEQDAGIINADAAIRLNGRTSAQKLFDDLYALGFRPSDGKNNDAAMKAKDEHIADLRTVMTAYLPKPPSV